MYYPLFLEKANDNLPYSSYLEEYIAHRIFEGLDGIKGAFKCILFVGSARALAPLLQNKYPDAECHYLDTPTLEALSALKGTSFDAVFLLGFFATEMEAWLKALHQLLSLQGQLFLSTFGPDTYIEEEDLLDVPDMHHWGDALLRSGYAEPVSAALRLEFTYDNAALLKEDLDDLLLQNIHPLLSDEGQRHLSLMESDIRMKIPQARSFFLELLTVHAIKMHQLAERIETQVQTRT